MIRLVIVLSVLIVTMISCKKMEQDSGELKIEKLKGLWVIKTASRNGLETNTLQGLFYKFDDSLIISNITGDTSSAPYVIKDNIIVHMIEDTINYDIAMVNDSFLEISSVIRSMPFQFSFQRQTDTIVEEQILVEEDSIE